MDDNKKNIWYAVALFAILVLLGVGFWLYQYFGTVMENPTPVEELSVDSPVNTSNNQNTNTNPTPTAPVLPVVAGGCFVSGCSSQICSEDASAVSTCEYREEYVCYQTARCERQTNGDCGWTQTPELLACIDFRSDMGVYGK